LTSIATPIPCERNIFGNRQVVYFHQSQPAAEITAYLQDNYARISQQLAKLQTFYLFPSSIQQNGEFEELLNYHYPDVHLSGSDKADLIQLLCNSQLLTTLAGMQATDSPGFILSIPYSSGLAAALFHFPLAVDSGASISTSIDHLLSAVKAPKTVGIQFSAGRRKPLEQDADALFEWEMEQLDSQLKAEMDAELLENNSKGALRMMLHILKQMDSLRIPMDTETAQLINSLRVHNNPQLSRLEINPDGIILLPDYNKEIVLEPIHRAVYLFFLLHPEGIRFKDLSDYKDALMEIYCRISKRNATEAMHKSVSELCNPFSNAMNEKCSRIRKGFLETLDERLAQHYVIQGGRNQPKRIPLNRNLVIVANGLEKFAFNS
jgi:hypothetical protein